MIIMGFFSRLFTFRGTVYSLRKKYDRLREKADREDIATTRQNALKILDQITPTLVMLEEQDISLFQRGKMVASVKSGIEQAKAVLDGKLIIK